MHIIWVMLGGAIGAASRYLISVLATRALGTGFAFGTLIVNCIGCFFIGFLFELSQKSNLLSPSARLFLITGILGGLTTFSTFALETVVSVGSGPTTIPILNMLANNLLGIVLVFLGIYLARLLLQG